MFWSSLQRFLREGSSSLPLFETLQFSFKVFAVTEFTVLSYLGGSSKIEIYPPMRDDPKQRKPSIERAKQVLGWEPKVC